MTKVRSPYWAFVFIFLSFFLFSQTAYSGVAIEHEAKALAKECFCGIGDSANDLIGVPPTNYLPNCSNAIAVGDGAEEGLGECSCPDSSCNEPGPAIDDPSCTLNVCRPKVDESYPWGLTKVLDIIWLGTFANALCQAGGAFFSFAIDLTPTISNAFAGYPITVCENEFGPSTLPDIFGDQRPPSIYTFDTTTNWLSEKSVAGCKSFTAGFTAEQLLAQTGGLRSAGSLPSSDIVILAGPGLNGVNMFAFRASTQQCIGAKNFSQYNDIRRWLKLGLALYAGVGKTAGGGSILRWAGTLTTPLNFITVGTTDSPVANIAKHVEGGKTYIAVTTWPNLNNLEGDFSLDTFEISLQNIISTLNGFSALYISPQVPISGLNSLHATQWKKVWQILNYDPGTVTAAVVGGGDLASYNGKLYWGTIQVPATGFIAHALIFEPDLLEPTCSDDGIIFPPSNVCEGRIVDVLTKTDRPTAVFRGSNLATVYKKIELLYGEKDLLVYDPNQGWTTKPNKMSQTPKFGASGIGTSADPDGGNPNNNYSWTAAVWNGKLWWGTFDETLPFLPEGGGDLWFFDGNDASEFQNAFFDGAGNTRSWGVRNVVSDGCLWLGMANGYNLHPAGGWELKKLYPMDPAIQAQLGCFPDPPQGGSGESASFLGLMLNDDLVLPFFKGELEGIR